MSRIYAFCKRSVGRPVWVRTLDGRLYKGKVNKVTQDHLYLEPFGHGVALEDEKPMKGTNLLVSSDVKKGGKEISWGVFALPLLGIGAAGFLGGAIGGFLGARAAVPRYGYGGYPW